jgi:hypothetical protein
MMQLRLIRKRNFHASSVKKVRGMKFLSVTIVVSLILLSSYFSSSSLSSLSAATRTFDFSIGLKAGNWIKYSVSVSREATIPNPYFTENPENVSWVKDEVENTTLDLVNALEITHFKNGTETSHECSINIGDVLPGLCILTVIPIGLKTGEAVAPPSVLVFGLHATVNQTKTGIYAGASRSVDVVNISRTGRLVKLISVNYYDRETGALLEVDSYSSLPVEALQTSVIAIDTNIWASSLITLVSTNPFYSIIVAFAAIEIAFLIIATLKYFQAKWLRSRLKE